MPIRGKQSCWGLGVGGCFIFNLIPTRYIAWARAHLDTSSVKAQEVVQLTRIACPSTKECLAASGEDTLADLIETLVSLFSGRPLSYHWLVFPLLVCLVDWPDILRRILASFKDKKPNLH